MFSKEYDVKYYEQNVNKDLKESALLNFLQDIATVNAEMLGFGPTFVFSNNYAWVVLKYHIELEKPLRDVDCLEIKTEPRGISKLCAYRDFELFSNGEKLGKVASSWTLIDVNSRRMLPLQKVLPMMFPVEKRDGDLEYRKIEALEMVDFEKEFSVRFDDIDVNRHANNSNYIVWALETLSDDFRLQNTPKSIDIKHRKEIGAGGKIIAQTQLLEDFVTIHTIKDAISGDELSSLKIQWNHEITTIL